MAMSNTRDVSKNKKADASCCGCLSFLFKPKKTHIELIKEKQVQRMLERNERHRMQIEIAADKRAEERAISNIPYHRF
jgi:hypothetical protein